MKQDHRCAAAYRTVFRTPHTACNPSKHVFTYMCMPVTRRSVNLFVYLLGTYRSNMSKEKRASRGTGERGRRRLWRVKRFLAVIVPVNIEVVGLNISCEDGTQVSTRLDQCAIANRRALVLGINASQDYPAGQDVLVAP